MKRFNFEKQIVESAVAPERTDVLWLDKEESTGKLSTLKEFKNGEWVNIFGGGSAVDAIITAAPFESTEYMATIPNPAIDTFSGGTTTIPNLKVMYPDGHIETKDATLYASGISGDYVYQTLEFHNGRFVRNIDVREDTNTMWKLDYPT